MKNTLSGIIFATLTISATAAPVEVTDPARSERCHAGLEMFDLKKSKYVGIDGDALLLDGNEATGRQFPAGQHQFLIKLAKARTIDRLNLVGTGSATFTVSVADSDSAPGASWQPILKNVKLSDRWGTDRAVNRTARYILVEANASSIFTLNEFAIYGQLTPIGILGGHRYLIDVIRERRSNKAAEEAEAAKLLPIKTGPKGFFPGRLGFPPRVTAGGFSTSTRRAVTPAPRGVIGTAPMPAVR
jgi:hypothetical protein